MSVKIYVTLQKLENVHCLKIDVFVFVFPILFLCLIFFPLSILVFLVGSKPNPGKSCNDILVHGGTVSGNYYIRLGGKKNAGLLRPNHSWGRLDAGLELLIQ